MNCLGGVVAIEEEPVGTDTDRLGIIGEKPSLLKCDSLL